MKNTISFIPASEEVEKYVSPPVPTKTVVPDWYKRADTDYLKNPIFDDNGSLYNTTIKQCVPFLDSMTAGYVQKTWCDIYINPVGESVEYSFSTTPKPIGMRPKTHIKYFEGEFYPIEFYWEVPWQPKVPKGYSVLSVHPLNRTDLPFTTLSGLVDSDGYYHGPFGNMPFYVKAGFRGIIPAGTPMFQYIPIKRESWQSVAEPFSSEQVEKRLRQQRSKFWGFYKENFWARKEYY